MSDPVRILLADDHPIVRSGLRGLLDARAELDVIAEAGTADEAVEAARRDHPDVVVLDLSMPGGGFDAIARLRSGTDAPKVLVLTMHDDAASVRSAFRAGANGYVVKRAEADQLVGAILEVNRGEVVVDRTLDPKLAIDDAEQEQPSLSRRERQVLELVARGHTNKEVAELLRVSVKSVETYRSRVLEKLGLKSRAELVRYAIDAGLLDTARVNDA